LRDAGALEAERLLYVACTRAKWQLRLTATIDDARPDKAGSLLAVLWPSTAAEFAVGEHIAGAHETGAPRGGALQRVPRNWAPHFLSGLPAVAGTALPVLRAETPVFDWAGETARRVGTLVHAELQSMRIADADGELIRARQAHFGRWLALHGVPQERLQDAASRVVEALIGVLTDPRGRWIMQAAREDFREHALSGRVQGEVARVVFDRSFIDDLGVRWVIDYKTSRHVGGGLEEFLDREVERYRPQLQRYALLAQKLGPEPVRLGLYFPLMQAWREWAA
jgi:ATP-dependent exoDNAse (exonuclease V) beta subunit